MLRVHLRFTDVTEGWSDIEGVDVEATNRAYAERYVTELQKAFPNATITYDVHTNAYGSFSDSIRGDSYDEEEAVKDTMSDIADKLGSNSESWVVMK